MLLPAPPDSSMCMRLGTCGCETSATRWQAHCVCPTASCAVHVDVVPGSPGGPARLRRRTACSLMRDPMSRYWIRKQGSRVKNRAPSAAGNTMARMPAAAELHAFGASLHSGVQPSHFENARLLPPCCSTPQLHMCWWMCPAAADAVHVLQGHTDKYQHHAAQQRTCYRASCILVAHSRMTLWPAAVILAFTWVHHEPLLAGAVLQGTAWMVLLLLLA